jgi:hypothetical protein
MFDRSIDHVYLTCRTAIEGMLRDGRAIADGDGFKDAEISARGLAIPSTVPLELGTVVDVQLQGMGEPEWQRNCEALVVGCEQGSDGYRVTLLFLDALVDDSTSDEGDEEIAVTEPVDVPGVSR